MMFPDQKKSSRLKAKNDPLGQGTSKGDAGAEDSVFRTQRRTLCASVGRRNQEERRRWHVGMWRQAGVIEDVAAEANATAEMGMPRSVI
jgi:hypothetical protein